MNKCIRMGTIAFKFVIWEGKSAVLRSQITFYALLTRRRKTKFPTVKPPIYLPKWKIWMQLSPKCRHYIEVRDDVLRPPYKGLTTVPSQKDLLKCL